MKAKEDTYIGTVRFIEFGKLAPKNSRFKGIITTESLVGFKDYTGRDDATEQRKELGLHEGGLLGYTSRDSAISERQDNNEEINKKESTFSSMGWLDKETNKIFKNEIRKAFRQNGNLSWDTVISIPSFEKSMSAGLIAVDNYAAICKKVLPKVFKSMKLDPENMLWWGDYHCNTEHPHMHIVFLEKHQTRTKGKMSEKELAKFKQLFFQEIAVREKFIENIQKDIPAFFKAKDHDFKELLNTFNPKLLEKESIKIKELYAILPKTGRFSYNSYQIAPYKQLLNKIISEQLQSSKLKSLYNQWLDKVDTLDETMNSTANSKISNLRNQELEKLYTQMGNKILKNFKEYDPTEEDEKKEIADTDIESSQTKIAHISVDINSKKQKERVSPIRHGKNIRKSKYTEYKLRSDLNKFINHRIHEIDKELAEWERNQAALSHGN